MEISDVRVRLVRDANERLKAVCSITLDREFVVRDVKIVEGSSGLFVAMPSRKLSAPCPRCRAQNYVRAKYCSECGAKLPAPRIRSDSQGREKAHRDVAHPISASFRQAMQERVLDAYRSECEGAEDAGYATGDVDDYDTGDDEVSEYDTLISELKGGHPERRRHARPAENRREPDTRHDADDRARRRRHPKRRRDDRGDEKAPGRLPQQDATNDQPRSATSIAAPDTEDEEAFGAELDDVEPSPEPASRNRERPQASYRESIGESHHKQDAESEDTPAPAQAEKQPPDDDADDDFGAGIL